MLMPVAEKVEKDSLIKNVSWKNKIIKNKGK